MFKSLVLFFVTASALASPLNSNEDVNIVQFEDDTTLVYKCEKGAVGYINLIFVLPNKQAYPVSLSCGIGA